MAANSKFIGVIGSRNMSEEHKRTAVEVISERVAEVTALAEQLDLALYNKITSVPEPSLYQQDWFGSFEKSVEDSSRSSKAEEEEFVTASECTCTPPSRSSSYHTAVEGYLSPWWADRDCNLIGQEIHEVIETQKVRFSKDGCTVEKKVEGGSEASSTYHAGIAKRAVAGWTV